MSIITLKQEKLKPQLTTIDFNKIDEGLKTLEAGKVKGRLVATINEK